MSALPTYLQSELSLLSNEARRKYPDIKEACEKVILIMRASKNRSTTEFAQELAKTEETLKPIFLACNTKQVKLVSIALGCLQKLILSVAVPESSINQILKILSENVNGSMEVQLRVLQIVLPLLNNYDCIRGELLNNALMICFKLQDSKVAVVNNTAAATLRQLVIFTFDKKIKHSTEDHNGLEVNLEHPEKDLQTLVSNLSPDAKDAYFLFQDFCFMTSGESPILLKVPSISRSFGLELIESVLVNQAQVFKKYPEFTALLKEKLCPFLIRAFSDKGDFPQTVRTMRLVFLIISKFSDILAMECEIFVTMLLKTLETDTNGWNRILAAESIKKLCTKKDLLTKLFKDYDLKLNETTNKSNLFGDIVNTLAKAVNENSHNSRFLASNKANFEQNRNANFSGPDPNLFSVSNASMRLQCIDQLDRNEPPTIAEGYLLLVILQTVESIVDGLIHASGTDYAYLFDDEEGSEKVEMSLPSPIQLTDAMKMTKHMVEVSWSGVLNSLTFYTKLSMDQQLTLITSKCLQRFTLLSGLYELDGAKEAFLECLYRSSFPYNEDTNKPFGTNSIRNNTLLGPNLSASNSPLTERHLVFFQSILTVTRRLGDRIGNAWYLVLGSIQYINRNLTQSSKSNGTAFTTSSPSTSTSTKPHSEFGSSFGREPLTEEAVTDLRQRLKQFFDDVKYLTDPAMETFLKCLTQLAVETSGGTFVDSDSANTTSSDISVGSPTQQRSNHFFLTLNRNLFKNEGSLFSIEQLRSVCLSSMPRLINQESANLFNLILDNLIVITHAPNTALGVRTQACEAISEIILNGMSCASSLRLDKLERLQLQVLVPLAKWSGLQSYGGVQISDKFGSLATVQKAALETLDKLLQNSGHAFTFGWNVIFDILLSACPIQLNSSTSLVLDPQATDADLYPSTTTSPPFDTKSTRSSVKLVRIAFPCLQLICTDFLAPLPPSCLYDCILTVGKFGLQDEDLNTSLTAVGMLWNVLDYLQKRLDGFPTSNPSTPTSTGEEKEIAIGKHGFRTPPTDNVASQLGFSQLMLLTLEQLASLCSDFRPEVRNGANQTLFRTLNTLGASLAPQVWKIFFDEVLLTLLDTTNDIYCGLHTNQQHRNDNSTAGSSMELIHHSRNTVKKQWDETRVLILSGLCSLFKDFLFELSFLENFPNIWESVLTYIKESALIDSHEVSLAALKSFNQILVNTSTVNKLDKVTLIRLWTPIWKMWSGLGRSLVDETEQEICISRVSNKVNKLTTDSIVVAITPQHKVTKIKQLSQPILTWYMDSLVPLYEPLRDCKEITKDIETFIQLAYFTTSYPYSEEYPQDIDTLSPLQSSTFTFLDYLLKLDDSSLNVVLLKAIPDFCLLAFEKQPKHFVPLQQNNTIKATVKNKTRRSPKFVRLAYLLMEDLAKLYQKYTNCGKFQLELDILEAVFNMLVVPIDFKYNCPHTNLNNQPLWKLASTIWLIVIQSTLSSLDKLVEADPDNQFDYFTKVVELILDVSDVYFSKKPPPSDLSIQQLELDERFDIEILVGLFKESVPFLRHEQINKETLLRFFNLLQTISTIKAQNENQYPISNSSNSVATTQQFLATNNSTTPFTLLAKEQLAFAALRCLISLCMDSKERIRIATSERTNEFYESCGDSFSTNPRLEDVPSPASPKFSSSQVEDTLLIDYRPIFAVTPSTRVAQLASPLLMERCLHVLTNFANDIPLFGRRPLPRVRRDEILFLLRHLSEIQLPKDSCQYFLPSTALNVNSTTSDSTKTSSLKSVTEQLLRSTAAHLFILYPTLCEILWCRDPAIVGQVAVCLKRIGQELGLQSGTTTKLNSLGSANNNPNPSDVNRPNTATSTYSNNSLLGL